MTAPAKDYVERLREAALALRQVREERDALVESKYAPLAIVGVGCRLPGNIRNAEQYWEFLAKGGDAIVDAVGRRFPEQAIPAKYPGARWVGLLENVDEFDAAFFGISPREAELMDPQQRILLEVAWEAMEDAGIAPDRLIGSRTGVFMGVSNVQYADLMRNAPPERLDAYAVTGGGISLSGIAGRLSYVFGFQGPAVAVDTACSSSLVAIHLACQSLRTGESDIALAGGINLCLSPFKVMLLSQIQALSPDGRCKTFDARANGFVQAEGCGIIVVKRLADARRDGDKILALIRGSAVNQDGRSSGFTAPNGQSQVALLQRALEDARVNTSEIMFVETHGTGTSLGDPIELEALKTVLGNPRRNGLPCYLGAVKTNIGHLESAAGVAGLIKTALVVQRGIIPKNLHFRSLNPRVSFDDTPFVIPTQTMSSPAHGEHGRVAGVSAFGLSGTNAHVVVAQAPEQDSATATSESAHLLPLSAKSRTALISAAKTYARWLSKMNDASVYDLAYTAASRRSHHEYRLAVVGRTHEELATQLAIRADAFDTTAPSKEPIQKAQRIVFVFPGQGSQWIGMGRQLLAEKPAFQAALATCDAAIRTEAGFSVLEEIAANEDNSRLHEIDIVQPLLFAIEVGLAALWRSWGIEPDCVVGHSMGEVAAAHVAGILSLEDAAKVICRRSKLLKRISGQGAMALVELPMADAESAIWGYESTIGIGVSNGPRSTVLSGDPSDLEELLTKLEKRGIFCRRVKVDVASHSPQVDPLRNDLLDALRDIRPKAGTIPMRSTVTGTIVQGGELTGAYWWHNLRQPVRFSKVTQDLLMEHFRLFIELSPHPILLPAVEENLQELQVEGAAIASLRRDTDERRTMLEALSSLYSAGCSIDWTKVYPVRGRVVSLPTYPWQRERYWLQPAKKSTHSASLNGVHPLLGNAISLASNPRQHLWEQWIDTETFRYLADHKVQGEVVFPGTGYVELALAAGNAVFGRDGVQIDELQFEQMLALARNEARLVQVSLVDDGNGRASITIASKPENATEWVQHAKGKLHIIATSEPALISIPPHDLERRYPDVMDGISHYAQMNARELSYGETFQAVTEIRLGSSEILGRIELPQSVSEDLESYVVHPAFLDACFQAASWSLSSASANGPIVPVKLTNMRVYRRPGKTAWVHGRIAAEATPSAPVMSLGIHDDTGQTLIEIDAIHVRHLTATTTNNDPFADCIFELAWRKKSLASTSIDAPLSDNSWVVLLDSVGFGTKLTERLRQTGAKVIEVVGAHSFSRDSNDRFRLNPSNNEHWSQLLTTAFAKRECRGIIHCGALESATWEQTNEATLAPDLRRGPLSALKLVQALLKQGWRDVPRLYLLTRAAHVIATSDPAPSPVQATLWGLGRVLAMEHPELECTRIDLPQHLEKDDLDDVLNELMHNDGEDQVAYRQRSRYVERLVRGHWDVSADAAERQEPAAGRPYRLGICEPGVLERLALRPMQRRAPGPGEVEIEVEVAALNFLDVLLALGVLPDDATATPEKEPRLGGECAGRIIAIGPGCDDLSIGQQVIALAPNAMATHVLAKRPLVIAKPSTMTWEQAASIPMVFATAHYALTHVARLRPKERVLIHAGAGGVGMAAIQVAKLAGAEIFATAGNESKRQMLRNLGVPHVMDSRSLKFADDIKHITNGEGIDVVLNSLSGDFIDASLGLLREGGRFIEIGKRDYYENRPLGTRVFLKGLSFSLVDLRAMLLHQPDYVRQLLHELMPLFEDEVLQPLPCRVFPGMEAPAAFAELAQGKHTGKLALSMRDEHARLRVSARTHAAIRADATYLIAGGLGGLGLSLAHWMVEQGARSLVLVGRNAPSEMAMAAITQMRAAGADVRSRSIDISDASAVDALIAQIGREMPQLRGVVHAAAVLEDRTVLEMREEEFFRPMAAKVFGGWNLHKATCNQSLDFFIGYSGAAGLLGSAGQANYAAANTFLDALCHARSTDGLAGMSIQWGAFSGVGLAAAMDIRGKRLASRGSGSFTPEEGHQLLERLMGQPRPEVGIVRFDARQWVQFYPHMASAPFLSELLEEKNVAHSTVTAGSLQDKLRLVHASERLAMLEHHLIEQLGQVLRLDTDRIDKRTPFTNLGVDSLMSLELRNRLEGSLRIKLSAALLFTYSTIQALASHLLETLALGDAHEVSESVENEATLPSEDMTALIDKLEAFEEYLQ